MLARFGRRHKLETALSIGLLLVSACGKSTQIAAINPASDQQASALPSVDTNSTALYNELEPLDLATLASMSQENGSAIAGLQTSLSQYIALSSELCQNLLTIQANCPIKAPYIKGNFEQVSCVVPKTQAGVLQAPSIAMQRFTSPVQLSVQLKTADHQIYVLIFNKKYISQGIPGDSKVYPLTFQVLEDGFFAGAGVDVTSEGTDANTDSNISSQTHDDASQAPINALPFLNALDSVILVSSNPGSALTEKSAITVSLLLNNNIVLAQELTDMTGENKKLLATRSMQGYQFNLAKILEVAKSNTCSLGLDAIQLIKNKIITATTPTQNNGAATGNSGSKEQLIKSITAQRLAQAKLQPILDQTRNTEATLERELTASQMMGCLASEPIENISISYDGESIPTTEVEGSASSPKSPIGLGDPRSLSFELSSNILLTDSSFNRKVDSSFADKTPIASLLYLKLSKGGADFENIGRDTSAAVIGPLLGAKIRYKVSEKDIYKINAVTVVVNGRSVFSQSNLNIMLSSKNLSQTLDLRSNPDWIYLMQRTDCALNK